MAKTSWANGNQSVIDLAPIMFKHTTLTFKYLLLKKTTTAALTCINCQTSSVRHAKTRLTIDRKFNSHVSALFPRDSNLRKQQVSFNPGARAQLIFARMLNDLRDLVRRYG